MVLDKVISSKNIILNIQSKDKDSLFEELVDSILKVYPNINRKEALDALHDRESKMTTGIMHGIAVPHASCPSSSDTVGAIGICRDGMDYNSLDGHPVNYVFMLLSNPTETEKHLAVLKDLSSVLQNPSFTKDLESAATSEEAHELLVRYESNLLN